MHMTGANNGHHAAANTAEGSRARSVLLVGDACDLEATLARSRAHVERCDDWFDAVATLARKSFDAVVLPPAPAERRAESAVRTLRHAAGDARIVLVTSPAHEGLSRKMLALGCDDYLVRPVLPTELLRALGDAAPPAVEAAPAPLVRPPAGTAAAETTAPVPAVQDDARRGGVSERPTPFTLAGLAVAEIVLDALVREPADAAAAAIRELNARLPAGARLDLQRVTDRDPTVPPGMNLLSRVIRPAGNTDHLADDADRDARVLHLFLSNSLDESAAADLLGQTAAQIGRLLELQDRHCRLQKLAITDDLTGLYNARYFRHFLDRILHRAKDGRFPVTLLMFDIDSFKKYNDSFGHAVGDEILRQTAKMIRRCVRDHDLVARLGGDEFAVVFWEKDGPRQVIGGGTGKLPTGRPPQSPVSVFERFKRMIAGHDLEALGSTGRGQLTISGGLAVYPYDARTPDELIEAADKALMFGAKKSGKNTIHLVGQE